MAVSTAGAGAPRRGDRLPRDHLTADAELGGEEALAVVAQLPGDVEQPLVEAQVQVRGGRVAQPAAGRLGQEVGEDEPAQAFELADDGRPAASCGDALHLGRQLGQERVVDARLAAGDEGADLREVDDVHVALAENGELDRRGGLLGHDGPRPVA